MLYTDSTQIYTLDVTSMQTHHLTTQGEHNYQPQWFGKSIAYVSEANGVSNVYIMDADGSNVRQVTHDGKPKQIVGWQPQ
jgi:TolB protein